MISQKNRFHGHGALNYMFSKGKTVRTEFLALRYVVGKKSDYRLAVVVSKKVSKSAVVRNRIRRRIYEVVRLEKKSTSELWPVDMAITVYDARIAEMPSEVLTKNVVSLLSKAKIV